MDVAAVGMAANSTQIHYQASISMLKNVMSMAEDTIAALLEGMEGSVEGLGENIDTYV